MWARESLGGGLLEISWDVLGTTLDMCPGIQAPDGTPELGIVVWMPLSLLPGLNVYVYFCS